MRGVRGARGAVFRDIVLFTLLKRQQTQVFTV